MPNAKGQRRGQLQEKEVDRVEPDAPEHDFEDLFNAKETPAEPSKEEVDN